MFPKIGALYSANRELGDSDGFGLIVPTLYYYLLGSKAKARKSVYTTYKKFGTSHTQAKTHAA